MRGTEKEPHAWRRGPGERQYFIQFTLFHCNPTASFSQPLVSELAHFDCPRTWHVVTHSQGADTEKTTFTPTQFPAGHRNGCGAFCVPEDPGRNTESAASTGQGARGQREALKCTARKLEFTRNLKDSMINLQIHCKNVCNSLYINFPD